jgi:hypothetical protein
MLRTVATPCAVIAGERRNLTGTRHVVVTEPDAGVGFHAHDSTTR